MAVVEFYTEMKAGLWGSPTAMPRYVCDALTILRKLVAVRTFQRVHPAREFLCSSVHLYIIVIIFTSVIGGNHQNGHACQRLCCYLTT